MPMQLDDGWNQIQFNLSDFTRRAYGTNYIETLRVQIHANCRIRRIYFSDRLYSEEELPPEFKLYLPMPSSNKQNEREHHVENDTNIEVIIENQEDDVNNAETDVVDETDGKIPAETGAVLETK
jgi:hypothetical protein